MTTPGIARPPDVSELSGYSTEDRYLATKYTQGGRSVFNVDLAIPQLVSTLPKPDPDRRLEGNRRINLPHARSFASYVRREEGWVAPAILLRAPEGVFEFGVIDRIGGTEWGTLSIPRHARADLAIIDGQHRTLGFHLALEDQAAELSDARAKLASAKKLGEGALVKLRQADVTRLEDERRRLAGERVSIQVVIVEDADEYKQVFVDIANNAKGITVTTRVQFDRRQIVNRCLDKVMEHRLLHNRVDIDRDRIVGSNTHLMGAKHVADIIRTLEVGIVGRITRRLEDELEEAALIEQANLFLETLTAGFEDLAAVADGSLPVPDLRARSLLGSTAMHRVLAGCYRELTNDRQGSARMNRLQVQRFFEKIAPFMVAPVTEESPWRKLTGDFPEKALAPVSRAQNLKNLTNTLVTWAIAPPAWLEEGTNP